MTTKVIHHGDESHILYIARVSSNQENNNPSLLRFLIRQNHWSPFEMIGACVEIETTRVAALDMISYIDKEAT